MTITTDGELLKRLGMKEVLAASLISKSRQTLNIALTRSDRYFNSLDLFRIRNFYGGDTGRLLMIDEHIRNSRGQATLDEVRLFCSVANAPALDLEAAKEVWATMPDVRFFKVHHIEHVNKFAKLADRNPAALTIFVEHEEDVNTTRSILKCAPENQPKILVYPAVGGFPYTILLEPRAANVTGWVLGNRVGYQKVDNIRADAMATLVARKMGLQTAVSIRDEAFVARL